MRIDIHVHVHGLDLAVLHRIEGKLHQMSEALDDLTAKVAAQGTVIDGAVTLLDGLKAQLDAAGTDPAKLQALSDQIGAQTSALSEAVARDTSGNPVPNP